MRCPDRGGRVGVAALLLVGVLSSHARAQGVRMGQNRIVVTANPSRLPADGQTVSRIRVEVRDLSNNPVPDGTEVVLSTDIGDLTSDTGAKQNTMSVPTSGGFALANLTSQEPGSATVRAQYLDSRYQVLVEVVPLGEAGRALSTVVHVRGGWVGYASDLGLIEARGPAELRYRGLEITADSLQLEPMTLVVRAYGVKLKRNETTLEGEDVYLPLSSMKGVLRRFGDQGVEEVRFSAFTLKPSTAQDAIPDNAFRADPREARIWMVARSVALFPNEKIVLRNASLNVDGHKLLSYPPYWVVAFEGYQGASNSNFVSFGTTGGLAVDFPIFFSVTDTQTGAIKIQRGAVTGSVMARQGWSFALEQTYHFPAQEAEGSLTIAGLPRNDWGVVYQDQRKLFGGADSSLSIAWPDHHSLFSDLSIFKYGRGGNLGVQTHFDSQPEGGGLSYGLNADFLSSGTPLGSGLSFRWGTGVEASRDSLIDDAFVFEHRVSTFLDFQGWRPSPATSIVPSVGNLFAWDTGGRLSNVSRAQLSLSQRLAQGVNLSTRYGVEYRAGSSRYDTLDTHQGFDQQVSLNLSAFASRKWDASLNASYGITDSNLYAFGALNYRPWRRWRIGLISNYYRFDGTSFDDLEVSLNRTIWGREVGVYWSKADGRFSFQVGNFSF